LVESIQLSDASGSKRSPGEELDPTPMYDIIELLFFAYRDFVGDADRLLENYKFGRAHHRVLHFVNRQPGLKIAEILAILQITKQSLQSTGVSVCSFQPSKAANWRLSLRASNRSVSPASSKRSRRELTTKPSSSCWR
jgi:hypothetical protein